jgi:xanthine/CO dehydrogenase XdhC/CoxF family maturation factor
MKEWIQIVHHIESNLNLSQKMALATVIQVEGSAYRRVGARMLILEDGTWLGSISGGCLEGDMLKKALLAMDSQSYKLVTYDTREEDPFELGIGLGCNGKIDILINPFIDQITLFSQLLKQALTGDKNSLIHSKWNLNNPDESIFSSQLILNGSTSELGTLMEKELCQLTELIPPQPRIWIFGSQFDSVSLIQICHQLGWRIFWIGNKLKMKSSHTIHCEKVFDWSDELPILPSDYVVFMTHDFEKDLELMTKFSSHEPFAYWGILGPKLRMQKLLKQLNESGVNLTEQLISSPIGLDLGAEGPDEIAVSIVAEILAQSNQRTSSPLKFRNTPIHSS